MSRLLFVMALAAAAAGPAPSPLRVRASPAVAPCVTAAALEYERVTGRKLAVETAALGMPESADGADVVVAADQELNRIIESGTTHPDLDVDVAKIPWVLAGAAGSGALDAQSLGRTTALSRARRGAAWRSRGFHPPASNACASRELRCVSPPAKSPSSP
jgi:hypothetical protein